MALVFVMYFYLDSRQCAKSTKSVLNSEITPGMEVLLARIFQLSGAGAEAGGMSMLLATTLLILLLALQEDITDAGCSQSVF